MEGKISKRELTTLVIGVVSLVVLTLGATFAYFQVAVTDTSGTTTITGDIGGATLGTVTLTGGDTELYLGLSMYDMSESKKGTTYYSSTEEGGRETSKASAGKTTYTATLSGDTTNSVMYACDYEFTVSASGSMLGKTSTKDVEIVFEGDINQTVPLASSQTVSGTWYGFKESNKERSFNAYLQLKNTENTQNDLVGTSVAIEIENAKWECHLNNNNNNELVGEAYAIYTEGNQTLTFLRSETPINVGDTHNGENITKVYTGIEENTYGYMSTPWYLDSEDGFDIDKVVFEDEIRPISTAGWFGDLYAKIIGLDFLNTSLVTDMSGMFYGASIDTDLSNWDVSNVTNMSDMFAEAEINVDMDLSGWDVSNVKNMRGMFYYVTSFEITGLSQWDVSNVTSMSEMFAYATINTNLDLSGWDVSGVTIWGAFKNGQGGTGTLTPPVWKNAYIGIYSETDYSLRIYNDVDIPMVGDTYNGKVVTKVYNISAGITGPVSCSSTVVPTSIIVEDIVKPINISGWFRNCTKVNNIDLTKLDISNVTSTANMFYNVGSDTSVTSMTIKGIDKWDTSSVLHMTSMFYNFGLNATYTLDLSGWDVANVGSFKNFNYGVETKVIAPTWNTQN